MGNITHTFINFFIDKLPVLRPKFDPCEILNQEIYSIEERCDRLEALEEPKPGFRSFIVLKTVDNVKLRVEYAEGSVEPYVVFNYTNWLKSNSFRFQVIEKRMSVKEALKIIRKNCVKNSYHWVFHNSQCVARDSISEITGTKTNLIRNHYLKWLRRRFIKADKNKAHERDRKELDAKKMKKTVGPDNISKNFLLLNEGLDREELIESLLSFIQELSKSQKTQKVYEQGFEDISKNIWKKAYEKYTSNNNKWKAPK